MRFSGSLGKYQLGPVIGEGTFAKVKVAKNTINGQQVAIKIIDKIMVQSEIRTMKLLNHPNIVRIHEVLASKTKIYIVMEYVPGGQLSDKLSYAKKLSEKEARKLFQQLIDAVEYCHCKGVYHRDLKPQNLLLDSKGNLKISDFGLSALQKPGSLLSTACGSPSYVAPELIRNRGYDGSGADIWACGVILFEMLSGYLPFNDQSLPHLYKKILEADYTCPEEFTKGQRNLLSGIFKSDPEKRITIPEITEEKWFQTDYEPTLAEEFVERFDSNDDLAKLDSVEESDRDEVVSKRSGFINAFQLIAMSKELDLSGLFEEKENGKQRIILVSKYTISETLVKIVAAARDSSLLVERKRNSKIKMLPLKTPKTCRPCVNLMAEVIEVAPTDCVVELSKSTGELRIYHEFCRSLSSLLGDSCQPLTRQTSRDDSLIGIHTQTESSSSMENAGFRGYASS
ncbi:hypothetical protein V2J09_002980 [Rumex salicifolius]